MTWKWWALPLPWSSCKIALVKDFTLKTVMSLFLRT